MADITIECIGDKEFHDTMLRLTKSLPNDKVEPVMMEGAKIIADAARAAAPKGPTGNLKKGIKAKFLKPISLQPRSAAAVSNAPHDHLVEYGTAPRTQKKTGRYTGSMPAHPFFRPAVDSNKGRVQNQVIEKLWNMIMAACK